jgi:hypothetical protein
VYWVEYGTRDSLGNYKHDGTLLSYAPDDGTTSVVASGLEGPIGVEVTTSHAYVYVDGARPLYAPAHLQLLRVPLAGGSAELVQEGAFPSSFAAAGSQAFWETSSTHPDSKIFTMTSDADAAVSEFVADSNARKLTIDGTDLYYAGSNGLTRTPTDSAAPVALGLSATDFALHDDSVYALDFASGAGGLLTRAPKTGGEFLRVRALGPGAPSRLRRAGDRYFFEALNYSQTDPNEQLQVLSASFVDDSPPIRLLYRPSRNSFVDHLWVASENALYWSEGRAIYKQPLPIP